MKHLFLVHSPITYLVSVSIIYTYKINKKDAIIIFIEFDDAMISEQQLYTRINLNEFYESERSFKKFINYIRHFNVVSRIDKLIDIVTENEKFTAYVPVLTMTGKTLITHRNCVSFNFIEEGLGSYYHEETLEILNVAYLKDTWRSSLLKPGRVLKEMYMILRGYNFKLLSLPFSYAGYGAFKNIRCFGLTEEAFPLIAEEKKIILDFSNKNFLSIKSSNKTSLNDKIIWIGDPSVIHYGFTEDLYIEGIEKGCIGFLKQHDQYEVLIKFHRDEPESLRDRVKKTFNDNKISFQLIPDNVIMELLLFESTNTTLIGVYSSLLYYAAIMGHNSFSIYEFVKKEYSRAIENRDLLFYWRKVNLINSVNEGFRVN